MVATTGFTGIGAKLMVGDGVEPTEGFTPVANAVSLGLTTEADQIDATHLLSTSGYREYKQGFKSASVDFEYHFNPDDSKLLPLYDSGVKTNFKLDFTGADNGSPAAPVLKPICSFSGIVTAHSVTVGPEMVNASGTISMASSPVWAAT